MRVYVWLVIVAIAGCGQDSDRRRAEPTTAVTSVVLIGTIQDRHLTSERYPMALLRSVIQSAQPDVILAEIPPDRFEDAWIGYEAVGTVTEPRVSRFPEYEHVIFPLKSEMGFDIIPVAAWTRPMAEFRAGALNRIANDPRRREEWQTYAAAIDTMNAALRDQHDDPVFIHSRAYDAIIKDGLTPYATLFAGDLGGGGWEAINMAHFTKVSAALDRFRGQGKTVVITFGAAHKYWFRRKLEQRPDVRLVDPAPYFERLTGT